MDFVLVEKWLVSLVRPETQPHVHPLIECVRENPFLQFYINFHLLGDQFKCDDGDIRSSALNGFLMGVCFSEAYRRDPKQMEQKLKEALEHISRHRGENVKSFLEKRAEKRPT